MIEMPQTLASPEVGGMNPVIMRMVVDFPAPLGPRKSEDFAFVDREGEVVHGAFGCRIVW